MFRRGATATAAVIAGYGVFRASRSPARPTQPQAISAVAASMVKAPALPDLLRREGYGRYLELDEHGEPTMDDDPDRSAY